MLVLIDIVVNLCALSVAVNFYFLFGEQIATLLLSVRRLMTFITV